MNSIQGRLTIYIITGTAVVILGVGLILDARLRTQLDNEFNRNLLAKAMTLVTLTEQDMGQVEFDLVEDLAPEFKPGDLAEYVQLLHEDGSVVSKSTSLGDSVLPYRRADLESPTFEDITLPDGRAGRLVSIKFVPIDDSANEDEEEDAADEAARSGDSGQEILIDLVLAQGKEPLAELLVTMRTTLVLSFLLLMVLLAGLARFSIRAGLKPLRLIAGEVQHIGADNLQERVTEAQEFQELQPITRRLNDLLARLEQAFDREKRFSGNVAHELRTPIAELRALAEVGKEWPSEREMVERFFGDLVDLADDMERTVANLLMLARIDAGTQGIKRESFDLASMVDGIVDKFSSQVEEQRLRIRNDVAPGVAVTSDKDKLKLILINIIYNAITYSPEGSEISIRATQINAHMELSVSNDAVDLNQHDVSMMFERFWRKEQIRAGGSHAGLGLSLVKALAELLDLNVRPMLESGSRFTLYLSGLVPAS